ncbi:MAG TPA: DUF4331 domain-containing protein [Ktedonobacterales bacterium]|jgi:hypothetical protein
MSSHREAPEISKDPVADNTDVYAFVSPDRPDTVTLIANFIPLEGPAGGPNFYEFGDDVLYQIHIDNNGNSKDNIIFQFRFKTKIRNPNTFLYNTGQVLSLGDTHWNRPQFYSVTRVEGDGSWKVLGENLTCPPCNVGVRSMPNYSALAQAAVHDLGHGIKVFAGQRREGFYVDLGSVFDLAALRPFQSLHLIPNPPNTAGVDAVKGVNVHTIAIQIPKNQLTNVGWDPTDPKDIRSVIGVFASASRHKAKMREAGNGPDWDTGPWVQVSRLGNPLVNEVVIPMSKKDRWNATHPVNDAQFLKYVQRPELAGLLPVLYPGVFPNLAAFKGVRSDLVAILMTGIPNGVAPGFPGNFTGKTPADLLRLNMAIPPASNPNNLGLLGGDIAGFPNGRRVADDVVTIEIRAVAGATLPLVEPSFVPDGAASLVTDIQQPDLSGRYLDTFPYLGVPLDGYDTPSS